MTRKNIIIKLFLPNFLISLVAFCSCGQKPTNHKVESAAVELNNKAMKLVAFIDNPDSSRKAIALLEKATSIDSNYFLGHYNKLMFFNQLRQFDKAIVTIDKLIQIKPFAHDLYLTRGILSEQNGDTVTSKSYFQKSLTICNNVLDTMNAKNRDLEMLVTNKALNLIMLGDQVKANELLKQLYDSQTNEERKTMIFSLMNKSKIELLRQMTDNQ